MKYNGTNKNKTVTRKAVGFRINEDAYNKFAERHQAKIDSGKIPSTTSLASVFEMLIRKDNNSG